MTNAERLHNIYSTLTPLLPLTSDTIQPLKEALSSIADDMIYLNWITPDEASNLEIMLSAYWKHFKTSINSEYNERIV